MIYLLNVMISSCLVRCKTNSSDSKRSSSFQAGTMLVIPELLFTNNRFSSLFSLESSTSSLVCKCPQSTPKNQVKESVFNSAAPGTNGKEEYVQKLVNHYIHLMISFQAENSLAKFHQDVLQVPKASLLYSKVLRQVFLLSVMCYKSTNDIGIISRPNAIFIIFFVMNIETGMALTLCFNISI